MEADNRSFEPVKIQMVSIENSQQRYTRDDVHKLPEIAFWRLNLTALSQRHNLYFVATGNKIQVYKPRFPDQTLGHTPCLTLTPLPFNPTAPGYIDPGRPHSINHLVIGDLGNQEILLISTDSGNVAAYYTNSINAATKRDAYRFSTEGNADFVGVRPFFSQWVHESAWGLAIHAEGRMIAVSANKSKNVNKSDTGSKITVFAFALTSSPSGPERGIEEDDVHIDSEPTEWRLWSPPNTALIDTPRRDCNYKIVLGGWEGHIDNVPCVTFVNGPEDEAGCWLLSTDISCQMKMWQIWRGTCFKTWNFSNQSGAATPWTRHREFGWIVAALDINAFRPAQTMSKFVGHHNARMHYGYNVAGDSYDLTEVVRKFTPQHSTLHPLLDAYETDSSDEEGDAYDYQAIDSEEEIDNPTAPRGFSNISQGLSSDIDLTTNSADESGAVMNHVTGHVFDNFSESDDEDYTDLIENSIDVEILGDLSDDETNHGSLNTEEFGDSPQSIDSARSTSSCEPQASGIYKTPQKEDNAMDCGILTPPPSSSKTNRSADQTGSPVVRPKPEDTIQIPSVPIIHCSTSRIRLFAGPESNYAHIYCDRMLRQELPSGMEFTNFAALERLNMMHQIPELGVFLVATQIGRCAVCSLTKRKRDGLLGFRVDWILPTKKEERDGLRPAHGLLGIAVSAIQGHTPLKAMHLSEHDTDHGWRKNRFIHDTRTTFDTDVVVLGASTQMRQRSDITITSSPGQLPITVHREWAKPTSKEKWREHESSRRYRLMLTYTDLTVLTYELSRGVEREDVVQREGHPENCSTN